MRLFSRMLAMVLAAAASLILLVGPALASDDADFGRHVRDCAQTHGFDGQHNPGLHRGRAGWPGSTC